MREASLSARPADLLTWDEIISASETRRSEDGALNSARMEASEQSREHTGLSEQTHRGVCVSLAGTSPLQRHGWELTL